MDYDPWGCFFLLESTIELNKLSQNNKPQQEVMVVAKQWNEKEIGALLDRSDRAVERAILAIYNLQTADEKNWQGTAHLNGVGFNAYDAKFGSSLAEWLNAGRSFTRGQLKSAKKMAKKYRRQLVLIANQ
jgi:hypothetical protein